MNPKYFLSKGVKFHRIWSQCSKPDFTCWVIGIYEIKNEFSGRDNLTESAVAPADKVVIGQPRAVAVQVVHLEREVLLLLKVVGQVRSVERNK